MYAESHGHGVQGGKLTNFWRTSGVHTKSPMILSKLIKGPKSPLKSPEIFRLGPERLLVVWKAKNGNNPQTGLLISIQNPQRPP